MAFIIYANTIHNFSAIWLDGDRNLLEVSNPTVTIIHFESDVKVFDLQDVPMNRIGKGIYRYPLLMDSTVFDVSKDYLVIYKATDLRDLEDAFIEDSFQVVFPTSLDGLNISTVR